MAMCSPAQRPGAGSARVNSTALTLTTISVSNSSPIPRPRYSWVGRAKQYTQAWLHPRYGLMDQPNGRLGASTRFRMLLASISWKVRPRSAPRPGTRRLSLKSPPWAGAVQRRAPMTTTLPEHVFETSGSPPGEEPELGLEATGIDVGEHRDGPGLELPCLILPPGPMVDVGEMAPQGGLPMTMTGSDRDLDRRLENGDGTIQ